ITLISNTFSNNTAQGYGGGVYAYSSYIITFTNNVFSGNMAQVGGGANVLSISGISNLVNNTFYSNTAKQRGGGAFVDLGDDRATANIYNNIFWQNTANAGGNDGDDLYVESNGDGDATASEVKLYNNNFSGNANFGSGQSEDLYITDTGAYNHGGNIQLNPNFVNSSAGNFRLQVGSPCINTGNNDAPLLPLYDKDGNGRIVGVRVDMGAYEYGSNPITFNLGITISGTGSGSVSSSPAGINCSSGGVGTCNHSYRAIRLVTLGASPNAGSTFAGWSGVNCPCNGFVSTTCYVFMDSAKDCTAIFNSLPTYQINLTRSGDGRADSGVSISASGGGCNISNMSSDSTSCSAYLGSDVTITVTVPANYAIKWGGNCSSATNNTCTLNNVNGTRTVSVEIYKPKRVTVNISGAPASSATISANVTNGAGYIVPNAGTCTFNFGAGSSASCDVPYGSNVTLSATPGAGYIFVGWSGACSGTGTCVLNNITENKQVDATFNLASGGGGGGGGGCSMGAGASPINGLFWLLPPLLALARRIRK
ncbi:MAG: hypothetical protein NZ821_09095, partial [Gloeomargarita sp. SKYB31]|nr:hypothetical protein [Gloeomargarita sp. SKYB31]